MLTFFLFACNLRDWGNPFFCNMNSSVEELHYLATVGNKRMFAVMSELYNNCSNIVLV